MDVEVVEYSGCPSCGQGVKTTAVHTGGDIIRMTAHIDPGEDPATRCQYDGGPTFGGPRRREKFPGDTYL